MKKETRELILNDIDKINKKIARNEEVIKEHNEFEEINKLENTLLDATIKLLKKALIKDDINAVFEFTDQL